MLGPVQGARSCALLDGDCAHGRGKISELATKEALGTWRNFDPASGSRGLPYPTLVRACSAIGVGTIENARLSHLKVCTDNIPIIAVQISDCHFKADVEIGSIYSRALRRFHFGFLVKCLLIQAPGSSGPNPCQPSRPHAVKRGRKTLAHPGYEKPVARGSRIRMLNRRTFHHE